MTKRQKEENPSAFKHWFGPEMLTRISTALKSVYLEFDTTSFLKLSKKFPPLEMKARVILIREELYRQLPSDFPTAARLLQKAAESSSLKGFDLWAFTEFVQTYGLNHWRESMDTLYFLTQKFTGEFAVRPFLVQNPQDTYKQLLEWTKDENEHVRRWASEGSRPRLPWGLRLNSAIRDPKSGIQILEQLKYDDSLYVRKSVANHLNDITKDHPELAVKIARDWTAKCPIQYKDKIDWIIRRGLRTLVKKGDSGALALLGVKTSARLKMTAVALNKSRLKIGEKLEFSFSVASKASQSQKVVVDYILYFMKSNGSHSAKIFKLRTFDLLAKSKESFKKSHSLKPITTTRYYPGLHYLEIQINGKRMGKIPWKLNK